MKRYIILSVGALSAAAALADQTVEGTITDAHSRQGLAGVYVQSFSNAKFSTLTDSVGHFSITVPDHCTSLRVLRDGYQPQQLPIRGRKDGINTSLWPSVFNSQIGLEETSVQSLAAQVSDITSDLSIDNQIAASLSGQLRSMSRGGMPGAGAYVLLGGLNSLNANAQPLVVVDGVIMDMQYDADPLHDGAFNNLLADLSTQDIESVEVLRNGTAIYGAKGANGVVLINTRRGRSLSTKIDLTASYTFGQKPRLPQMMNASEYRTYVSELLGTTSTKATEFKFLRDDPSYYYYKVYHNETDWSKEVYQPSYVQNYNLNVQGGDDVAVYNLSIGYAGSDAALKYNDFSRFNMRINSDVNLTDKISCRLDASYSDVTRDLRDDGAPASLDGGVISSPAFLALIKSPFLSPYAYDTHGNVSHFLAGADDYLNEVLGSEASLANPSSILYYGDAENKNKYTSRLVTLGIGPSIKMKHGLKLTDAFNFTMYNTDEGYYQPVTGMPSYRVKGVGTVTNKVASSSSHQYLTNNDLYLSWLYNKMGHKLDLTGGWRLNISSYELSSMLGYNSGNDKLPNMSNSLSYKDVSGLSKFITTLTYYADGKYSWQDRVYAHAALSMEASSRFGKDAGDFTLAGVPWGIFASLGASWVISNEQWFNGGSAVNYLRLNAGWDLTGNDDLDLDASKTYFQAVTLFNTIGGVVAGNIGNTSLGWERTNRFNYGLDANLFNNRLSLSVNGFYGLTDNLVTRQSLPYVIGLSENWINGGSLSNVGVTADVRAKLVNTRHWQWQLGFSLGHYTNKVDKLSSGAFTTEAYGAQILTEEGGPVGQFYGFETDGVFSTSDEAAASGLYIADKTGKRTYFKAGDMHFVDRNGDKEINDLDRTVIGNPNPDLYGLINSRLAWRGLALDVVFSYSLGNDIYNYQRSILESGSRFYNQTTAMRGRWSSEGQHAVAPRLAYNDPMGNARFSDRWIEDGSYLRLQNVTLSYKWDFDYRFLQGITIWGAASNLFTLTRYLGSDPEVSASNSLLLQGIDAGRLPLSRQFTAGIKINL